MLHDRLLRLLLQKPPYKPRIPQLARDPEVLTAPHQSITLAPLRSRRYPIRVKVLLLAPCNTDQPPRGNKRILPRHQLPRHDRLPARRKAPTPGPEGAVQNAPVFDLGQVDDAVGLDFDVFAVDIAL